MKEKAEITHKSIFEQYERAARFKQSIGLYERVRVNENYFIGNQWEDVESNGLPTPVFNFLKRVTLFQVATITSDNMTIQASSLPSTNNLSNKEMDEITGIINDQFLAIFERERIVSKVREFMRNAAVDGDGCMYFYFDSSIDNGQRVKGEIQAEVIENTRVYFGNPNCRAVQKQPWVAISRRMMLEDVQYMAEKNGVKNAKDIKVDSDDYGTKYDSYTDDKVTVITYFYRNRENGLIYFAECTRDVMINEPKSTDYHLYPIIWMSWDYIQDCYHGQSLITGLIPNQNFVNKLYAATGVSLMTTAFPKIVYDKNRIREWSGAVGAAIGVAGNVGDVAKTIDPAAISPQVAQFIDLCIEHTQDFLGASKVALGNSRPDNTSAIVALQRAANTPMEITKQNMYQAVEDMGRIFIDMMSVRYGTRMVNVSVDIGEPGAQPLGMDLPKQMFTREFNFSTLSDLRLSIKLDVGASAYWSEVASMQTLDNLLMNGKITLKQYLERIPQGYISKKQELLDEINGAMGSPSSAPVGGEPEVQEPQDVEGVPVRGGPGYGALQRALNKTEVV